MKWGVRRTPEQLGHRIDKAYDKSKKLSDKSQRYLKKGSKLAKKGRSLSRYDDRAAKDRAFKYLEKASRYSDKGRRIAAKALRNDEWIKRRLASLENVENGKAIVEEILRKHALD